MLGTLGCVTPEWLVKFGDVSVGVATYDGALVWDSCYPRMGALIGLGLAKLIMQIRACLVMMGGVKAFRVNGLALVYLTMTSPNIFPGDGCIPQSGFEFDR